MREGLVAGIEDEGSGLGQRHMTGFSHHEGDTTQWSSLVLCT